MNKRIKSFLIAIGIIIGLTILAFGIAIYPKVFVVTLVCTFVLFMIVVLADLIHDLL